MTNPHEAADNAHVLAQQVSALIERQLHDAIQALGNRAALADHWRGVADAQRAEIERLRETIAGLQSENANLSAHLETVATERDEMRARAMLLEKDILNDHNPLPRL